MLLLNCFPQNLKPPAQVRVLQVGLTFREAHGRASIEMPRTREKPA
jgi:hypothetical protein